MSNVKSTCCYCGVGCGVVIEHDHERITGVRGDPAHPANFGRLCTKGSTLHLTARHEARAALSGVTRTARCRARASELGPRARSRCRPFCRDHPRARARQRRVLHLGPVADRGLLRLQQARQGPDRHQQRRHQFAAVHVLGGRRLQGDARRRCAARVLRGHRPRRVHFHRRLEHRVCASDPVPPHRGREGAQPGAQDHRRRSAPHRHRGGGRPVPADPARHRRRALQRDAARDAVGRPVRSRLHSRAHRGLRRAEGSAARIHAADGGRRSAACRPTISSRRANGSARRRRRCRCIARASISRRTAPTRTPR